jgi:Uma2 family endonuclease
MSMAARRVPAEGPLTIAEFEAMPEEAAYRIELVRGYVVREPRPATYHGLVATRIAHYLEEHVSTRRLGVVIGDAGFVLEEAPPSVRGPDVSFLSTGRIPADAPRRGFWRVGPDLAVEVLSPSNTRSMPRDKLSQYFAAGVQLVWVVNPVAETVTVQDAGGVLRTVRNGEVLDGAPVLPDLRIQVAALFGLP